MESFSINLNQMTERRGRYRRFLIVLGLALMVLSAIPFAVLHRRGDPLEWMFLILAIYALIFTYFAISGQKTQLFVGGNDFAIEYQFGFFKRTPGQIILQTVARLRVGPAYLAFYKRSGKRKVIPLGWLPYARVVEIKERVTQLCAAHGIAIEVVEFQRG